MARRVVIVLFGLAAVVAAAGAARAVSAALDHGGTRWPVAAYAVLQACLVASFAVLVLLRGPARRPSREPGAFVACTVALFSAALMAAPHIGAGVSDQVWLGEAVAFAGSAFVLISVTVLGRCFGILPEARGLVTRGPYRHIRHPVYLGELTAAAGLVLAAPTPRNLALGAALLCAQLIRIRFEERALTAAFPQYAEYASAIPMLLPFPRRPAWTAQVAAVSEPIRPSRRG